MILEQNIILIKITMHILNVMKNAKDVQDYLMKLI